jgi:hypothetical protein
VGIADFGQSQSSRNIESKTRFSDAIAIYVIQKGTDRSTRFSGEMMIFCDFPRCYFSTLDIFPENVFADKGCIFIPLPGIHSNVPHFLSLASVHLNEEIRNTSSNRGIISFDQSIKQGTHKIYPKKHFLKQSVEEGGTGKR